MGLDLLQRLRQQEQVSAFAVHVAGAVLPDRAGAAVRPPDQHRQSWLAIRHRGLPRRTHCPLWTRNGLGFPVDVKVFLGEAGPSLGARVLTYPRPRRCSAGVSCSPASAAWMPSTTPMSCSGAGVVTTCTMKCGCSSSQVSV